MRKNCVRFLKNQNHANVNEKHMKYKVQKKVRKLIDLKKRIKKFAKNI